MSVAAALTEEAARLITSGPLPRTMRARGPGNTSSYRRADPRLVQPDGAARDEKAREERRGETMKRGTAEGGVFVFT